MALLTPGYWPSTYWTSSYWPDDYWADFGFPVTASLSWLARYKEEEQAELVGVFSSGATVTVDIYQMDGTKLVTGASCTEIASTGAFKYSYQRNAADTVLWIMNDGTNADGGIAIFGGYAEDINDLRKDKWNRKDLQKDAGLQYTETLYDDDDSTAIREQELTKESSTLERRSKSSI